MGRIVYLHLPNCNSSSLTIVAEELRKAMDAGFFKDLDMRISVSNYRPEK